MIVKAIIITVVLLVIGLIIYTAILKYPNTCVPGCGIAPAFMNGDKCMSVKESFIDCSIPAPTPVPYIGDFTSSEGAGPPFCLPVWYAYRYVRNNDGAFGPLSQWSDVIYAGCPTMPCPPGGCSVWGVKQGPDSCGFNQPTIVLVQPLDIDVKYYQEDGYTLNVHRQVGYFQKGQAMGFEPTLDGKIVGSFMVIPNDSDGSTARFIDALYNPNVNGDGSPCC